MSEQTEQSLTVSLPPTKTLPIGQITPYFRNPRRIPQEAVDAVRTSLEKYGYQQPIVVDTEHVVIVGHTRLQAMQALGVTHVEVYVSDLPEAKAREYRLIDNRSSEMSQWDHTALVVELREWEQGLLDQYFPDVDLEIGQLEDALIETKDIEKANAKVGAVKEQGPILTTKVVCPSCLHEFDVRTDSLPGLSREDLTELADVEAQRPAG